MIFALILVMVIVEVGHWLSTHPRRCRSALAGDLRCSLPARHDGDHRAASGARWNRTAEEWWAQCKEVDQ